MNLAIVLKTARDTFPVWIFTCLGSVIFVVLFSFTMKNMGQEVLEMVSKFAFLKRMLEMGLGISVEGEVSLNTVFAICFTHLIILALGWSLVISTVTRVSVGEIERGTADLLFSLPVSRWEAMLSSTLVWVIGAATVAACPFLGVCIGKLWFASQSDVELRRFVPVVANLFSLHLAIGGLTTLFSAISTRRGPAIAMVIAVALISATLNFVEPFLKPLHEFPYLGLLHYFRPVDVVRAGTWPWVNLAVLTGFGAVCWLVGTLIFCRKDIPVA